MDVVESDHKPVFALLDVEFPCMRQDEKRKKTSIILKAQADLGHANPDVKVDNFKLEVAPGETATLTLSNDGPGNAFFTFAGNHHHGGGNIPTWLTIYPHR